MDLFIPLFFFILGLLLMILALYEERDTNTGDREEEQKSDNLIVILMIGSILLLFISAACFLGVTESYYSVTTDTMVTSHVKEYEPFAYVGFGFAMLNIILTVMKTLEMLDKSKYD